MIDDSPVDLTQVHRTVSDGSDLRLTEPAGTDAEVTDGDLEMMINKPALLAEIPQRLSNPP